MGYISPFNFVDPERRETQSEGGFYLVYMRYAVNYFAELYKTYGPPFSLSIYRSLWPPAIAAFRHIEMFTPGKPDMRNRLYVKPGANSIYI